MLGIVCIPLFYVFLSFIIPLLLLDKAIDQYIATRQEGSDGELLPKLVALLDSLFTHSLNERQYRHAIGIAMETHRMDWFCAAIQACVSALLAA